MGNVFMSLKFVWADCLLTSAIAASKILILVSFLRGIVSLVLFAAAVTTVVIDMEFIGEKLGKYKLLRYGLIAGVVLLLFLIG